MLGGASYGAAHNDLLGTLSGGDLQKGGQVGPVGWGTCPQAFPPRGAVEMILSVEFPPMRRRPGWIRLKRGMRLALEAVVRQGGFVDGAFYRGGR